MEPQQRHERIVDRVVDATPESHSVGLLAARLAASISGLDEYQIMSSNAASHHSSPPPPRTYAGYFEGCVVGIPEAEWKLATDFLNDSRLVLVRR